MVRSGSVGKEHAFDGFGARRSTGRLGADPGKPLPRFEGSDVGPLFCVTRAGALMANDCPAGVAGVPGFDVKVIVHAVMTSVFSVLSARRRAALGYFSGAVNLPA